MGNYIKLLKPSRELNFKSIENKDAARLLKPEKLFCLLNVHPQDKSAMVFPELLLGSA